jgi:hypothetical protein
MEDFHENAHSARYQLIRLGKRAALGAAAISAKSTGQPRGAAEPFEHGAGAHV